jgi:ATP/maltotriose-dependent transcriptional regulator MalT
LRSDVWLAASAAFCDLHRHDDAERCVRASLEAVEAGAPEHHRMRAISQLGVIAQGRGQFDRCEAHYAEALELATHLGSERSRGTCLGNLGIMRRWRGDLEAARKRFEEAEAVFRSLGMRDYAAYSKLNLAETRWFGGDRTEASRLAQDATRELRVHGAAFYVVIALTLLARMHFLEEHLETAEAYAMEARAIARRARLREHYVLYALAAIAEWRGDPELALELAVEALGQAHAKPGDVRSVLMLLAVAEGSRGNHDRCAWMSACAGALRDARSGEQDPANALLGARLDDHANRAREVLGADAYEAARAEGLTLEFSQAARRIFATYPLVPGAENE